MTMMSSMNNFSRLTEGRFLSPDCTVENPVLREVIRKIPTGQDGWSRLRFTSACSPEERERLFSLGVTPSQLEAEDSYAIFGEKDVLTVCSANFRGQLYGAYTLLQQSYDHGGKIPGGVIFNLPQCSFRGLKVYLPAPDALEEFYRTVDFLLYYRCNTIIIDGVHIGDNVVIGAGSVVTKDIPAGYLAYGNPCRPIRPITEADSKRDLILEEDREHFRYNLL